MYFFNYLGYLGIYSLEEKPIHVVVNDIDHIRFEINVLKIKDLLKSAEELKNYLNEFEQQAKICKDKRFGYFSPNMKMTGSGFGITSKLKLSNLCKDTQKLQSLIGTKKSRYYKILSEDIVEISAFNKIGSSEKEVLENWNKLLNSLIENDKD